MSDAISAVKAKTDSLATLITSATVVCGAVAGIYAYVAGFFAMPAEIKAAQAQIEVLRKELEAQQKRYDAGSRGERGLPGPTGPQGERGPPGPKGDQGNTGESARAFSETQLSTMIESKIAEALKQSNANVSYANTSSASASNAVVTGLSRQSDGCYLLPSRQISITVSAKAGAKFCKDDRSASTEIFAVERARNRIHLQTGSQQWTCTQQGECGFNWNYEYKFRIEFENANDAVKLVFFRP